VHGTGSVPGGVNRQLTPTERCCLRDAQLPQMLDWCETRGRPGQDGCMRSDPAPTTASRQCRSPCCRWCGRADGALDLYDGVLRVARRRRRMLLDGVDPQDYLDHIEEEVKPWTYMKFPYLRTSGRADGLVPRGAAGAGAELRPSSHAARRGAPAGLRRPRPRRPVHGALAYHGRA
jgi:NAD-reducing hydrogenase large subunit